MKGTADIPNDVLCHKPPPTTTSKTTTGVQKVTALKVLSVVSVIVCSAACLTLLVLCNLHIHFLNEKLQTVQTRIQALERNAGLATHDSAPARKPGSSGVEYSGLLADLLPYSSRVRRDVIQRVSGSDFNVDAQQNDVDEGHREKRDANRHRKCCDSVDAVHFEASLPQYDHSALTKPGDLIPIEGVDGQMSKEGFHPNGKTYKFWKRVSLGEPVVPDFLHISGDNHHFTIEKSGIYMIYAQVLYHDMSGRWAFGIYVDDNIRAQCTTSQHVTNDYIEGLAESHRASHGVYTHCYTGVVVHAARNQRVSVRTLYEGRTVVALGRSTFWGIVKLKSLEQ